MVSDYTVSDDNGFIFSLCILLHACYLALLSLSISYIIAVYMYMSLLMLFYIESWHLGIKGRYNTAAVLHAQCNMGD